MRPSISFTLTVLSAAGVAACSTQPVAVTPVTATVAVVPAGPAIVVPPTTVVGAPAAAHLSAADQQFNAVAAGGNYEVAAARTALARAASQPVRAYAQMLLDQHTRANADLLALVSSKGHRIGTEMPAQLQQKISTLSRLSGDAFDREFVRMTGVQDHMATIAAFEQSRGAVADNDLRAFIDRTLPGLRTHLQQAQDLAGRMAG